MFIDSIPNRHGDTTDRARFRLLVTIALLLAVAAGCSAAGPNSPSTQIVAKSHSYGFAASPTLEAMNAPEANYTYTTLDYPGAVNTHALGINDAGDVVGTFNYGSAPWHAFTYIGGKFHEILSPIAACSISLYSINNSGQVLGEITGPALGGGGWQPFLYDRRAILPLALSFDGTSWSLDNVNQLTDHTSLSAQDLFDFVRRREGRLVGPLTDEDVEISKYRELMHIMLNHSGDAAGYDRYFAGFVILSDQVVWPMPYFPAWSPDTAAADINDHQTVVGWTMLALGGQFRGGYIWKAGVFQWLDPPPSRNYPLPWFDDHSPGTKCNGVNNNDVVVGTYRDIDRNEHGFVARPG